MADREKIALPAGYTARPPSLKEAGLAVALFNAYSMDLLGREEYRLSDTLSEWTLPNVRLEETMLLVFSPDGMLAGYVEYWDLFEPFVTKYVWYRVHPSHRGLGIDEYLLHWGEEKARSEVNRAPQGARVNLQLNSIAPDKPMQQIFESLGFHHIRSGLRMVIDFKEPPPAPQWPGMITVQSMIPGKDERRLILAEHDAFMDHWGFVPEPFEAYFERMLHLMTSRQGYDPQLCFMALDGEQVAGVSVCYKEAHDDPKLGWVSSLGVCRPWRKRGLGLALLQHSFCALYRTGQRKVGLNVDADSLTGATRLYEKAGMRSDPTHTYLFYEKELRPGFDWTTRHLDP